jgi:hypothetical protein
MRFHPKVWVNEKKALYKQKRHQPEPGGGVFSVPKV